MPVFASKGVRKEGNKRLARIEQRRRAEHYLSNWKRKLELRRMSTIRMQETKYPGSVRITEKEPRF